MDQLPARADSAALVAAIGRMEPVHPDFSAHGRFGIPWQVVGPDAPRHRVAFGYRSESDRGTYPIPDRPRIERGSDRHLVVVDRVRCRLHELFGARRGADGRWRAVSGAIFDLSSNRLRPAGWTSADAAGLPILAGLVRHDEVAAGRIDHALRFTAPRTARRYIYPARHSAGLAGQANLPPMGLRVRLKRSVSEEGFGPQARVIVRALKRYGMILADNGSPWFITGAPHALWDDDDLRTLRRLRGADFEAVNTGGMRNRPPHHRE